jgi:hypothetical protein
LQIRQHHTRLCSLGVLLSVLVALVAPATAPAWTWPVDGPVLRPFYFGELDPEAPGQHRGIDIGAPTGTAVLSPVDATVTFAGTVPFGGKTLSLLSTDGLSVTLLHLGSFGVARGDEVREGHVVGIVGASGVSELTVPFVYLGVRRVEDPQGYLDPLLFLPEPSSPPVVSPETDPEPAPVSPPAPPVPAPVVAPTPSAPEFPHIQPPAQTPGVAFPRTVPHVRVAPAAETPSLTASAASPLAAAVPDFRPHVTVGPEPVLHPPVSRKLADSPRAFQSPPTPFERPPAHVSRPRPGTVSRPRFEAPSPTVHAAPAARAEPSGFARPATLLALALGLAIAAVLAARRVGANAVRIIDRDALLPDHTDLLRQLEAAHRPRVHDDRSGRARPAPSPAR